MKNKINYSFLGIISLLIFLASCQKNPATGENEINLMSEHEEDSIGEKEHQNILKQFGGEYKNEKLKNYINSIGNFLVSTSELPNKKFKFTILDTPIVNAFALPGGFIYLTRGLIYLCQNEAQLAGVIAHEIGHVTARHTARRYTKTFGTSLFLKLLGAVSKNNFFNNLIGQSASLYLLSYSRSQEFQADELATRYTIRAGFDPKEMANFLKLMEEYSNLQKRISKIDNKASELLQTHPNSSKRVLEVINNYQGRIPINPIIGEEIFLKKIDGLLYGHNEKEGFFKKNNFIHKPLKIKFKFSDQFYFFNYSQALVGVTEGETKIIFDLEKTELQNDKNYIAKWASLSKKKISNFQSFTNNGFTISIGEFIKNNQLVIVGTLRKEKDLTFRFTLLSNKEESIKFKENFKDIILSFQKINEKESKELYPPSIKIISVSADSNFLEKTIQKLNLQNNQAEEIFLVINNLFNKEVEVGKKIKVIY
jgi:predicted Zn-dependent protease